MGVVKNIIVRAVADFSDLIAGARRGSDAIRDMSNRMNRATAGLTGMFGGLRGQLVALAGTAFTIQGIGAATEDAMKFEAQMTALTNRLGESSNGFIKWGETTGRAFGYSKLQIAEYGNTFSMMLRGSSKDQEELSQRTTKLLETAAIIRSQSSFSQEEISRRIRSAMNQEADGADELGINVRTTAIEQSKAFATMAKGVKSFTDLSIAMQKAIIYQHIIDETTKNYGTTLAATTATKHSAFTASLKDLKLSLGQAFLPIYSSALPALTSLVSKLDTAIQKVAAFMRLLFGFGANDKSTLGQVQAIVDQSNAVDDLAAAQDKLNKAKKEGGLAGFDQVNVLPDPKSDKDKDGAGGTGDSFKSNGSKPPDLYGKPDEGIVRFLDTLKQRIKPVTDAWGEFTSAVKDLWKSIEDFAKSPAGKSVLKFFEDLAINLSVTLIDSLKFAVKIFNDLFDIIVDIQNGDWVKLGKDVKKLGTDIKEGWTDIMRDLILTIDGSGTSWEEMQKKADEANKGTRDQNSWGGWVAWFTENVTQPMKKPWEDLWSGFLSLAQLGGIDIKAEWATFSTWWGTNVTEPLKKTWNSFWTDAKKGATDAWRDTKAIFTTEWWATNVTQPLKKTWDSFWSDLSQGTGVFWTEFQKIFTTEWWSNNVTTPLKNAWNMLMGNDGDVDKDSKSGWQKVQDAFKGSGTWFETNVTSKIGEKFGNFRDDLSKVGDDAFANVTKAFLSAKTWFTDNVVTPVKTALASVTQGVGDGLIDGFKKVYNKIAGYLNNLINMWNGMMSSNPVTSGLQIPYTAYLPALAKGGITNGPMAALIGDNAGGREVVSPLSDLTGHISTAVIQALAFSQPSGNSKNNSDTRDIILNIDGRQFARIVKPYMDDANGSTTVMLNRI